LSGHVLLMDIAVIDGICDLSFNLRLLSNIFIIKLFIIELLLSILCIVYFVSSFFTNLDVLPYVLLWFEILRTVMSWW